VLGSTTFAVYLTPFIVQTQDRFPNLDTLEKTASGRNDVLLTPWTSLEQGVFTPIEIHLPASKVNTVIDGPTSADEPHCFNFKRSDPPSQRTSPMSQSVGPESHVSLQSSNFLDKKALAWRTSLLDCRLVHASWLHVLDQNFVRKGGLPPWNYAPPLAETTA
jgi:hypothetical protein